MPCALQRDRVRAGWLRRYATAALRRFRGSDFRGEVDLRCVTKATYLNSQQLPLALPLLTGPQLVAHALMRAASPLMGTRLAPRQNRAHTSVCPGRCLFGAQHTNRIDADRMDYR